MKTASRIVLILIFIFEFGMKGYILKCTSRYSVKKYFRAGKFKNAQIIVMLGVRNILNDFNILQMYVM